MPDNPIPAPAVSTNSVDPSVSKLVGDAGIAVSDIKTGIAAYKAGGLPAVAALSPTLVPHIRDIVADVQAAIPAIKTGYKTTEFWLVVAFGLANAIVPILTGKPLPFGVDSSLAAVLSIYAIGRALLKKPTAS